MHNVSEEPWTWGEMYVSRDDYEPHCEFHNDPVTDDYWLQNRNKWRYQNFGVLAREDEFEPDVYKEMLKGPRGILLLEDMESRVLAKNYTAIDKAFKLKHKNLESELEKHYNKVAKNIYKLTPLNWHRAKLHFEMNVDNPSVELLVYKTEDDSYITKYVENNDEEPLTLQDRANILGGIGGYSQEQVDEAYAQQEAYSNEIAETVQTAMTNSEPGNEENYAIPYTPSVAEQVTGGETEATQAYNVAMNEINNPTDVSTESINRGIAVGGGVASSLFIGRALHHEGMEMVDKVVSKKRVQSLVKPLAKSATKAVTMEIGGLVGDAAFTGINMNQNRIDFEGRPDLIEKADELDETSLAIGATGSAMTFCSGALYAPAGVVGGVGFIAGNTIYSFNAELEKDKLREEYRLWKTGKNE